MKPGQYVFLVCQTGWARLNFGFCYLISDVQNGKPQPHYELTRDGFVMVAMGFTGRRAIQWKEADVRAFSAMTGAGLAHRRLDLQTQGLALLSVL